jgi:hypothetical protein
VTVPLRPPEPAQVATSVPSNVTSTEAPPMK